MFIALDIKSEDILKDKCNQYNCDWELHHYPSGGLQRLYCPCVMDERAEEVTNIFIEVVLNSRTSPKILMSMLLELLASSA